MATTRVRIFEVPAAPVTVGEAAQKPVEVPGFAVDADTHDQARARAMARLSDPLDHGYTVRALSSTPSGLLAYVNARR